MKYLTTGEGCAVCKHPGTSHTGDGICHCGQHGALLACHCPGFVSPTVEAIAALSYEDRKLLACANYLGLKPSRIDRVVTERDRDGHVVGLQVIITVTTSQLISDWVKEHLPTEQRDWITEFLQQREQ